MVSPQKIKFQKIFSNELNIPDLIMDCAFDSDNSEVSTYLSREAVSVESHDGRRNNTIRYKYNERFSPRFTFMKKDFASFEIAEARAVLKWLTSSETSALLDVYYDNSNAIEWSAIGNWTQIDSYKIANNRTVGIVATFEAITPFAMSDIYSITKTITATDNKITINIDTDDNKPVYPRITIKHAGSVVNIPEGTELTYLSDMVENTTYFNGTTYYWKTENSTDPIYFHSSTTNPNLSTTSVKFTNTHTDFFNQSTVLNPTIIKNNNVTEIVILDGANKIISSNSVRRIFGDDFVDWHWLELYDGKNEITIEGSCEVMLEWREIRKIGEY